MGHLGENQGRPKCSSPFELIQNSKSKVNAIESPKKERRQNPGCHTIARADQAGDREQEQRSSTSES